MTVNAYSDVKICTAALALIGASAINTIDDPQTDKEATCATLYPIVKADILSRHEWNFANPLRQLAANADADDALKGGYLYAYKLPSDLLAGPFAVYANGNFKRPISGYQNINGHILSDENIIHVRYRSSPKEEDFPMFFVSLLVTALAARFAKPITDSTSLASELRIMAFGPAEMNGKGGILGTAKALDAQSQPMKTMFAQGDPLTATRY